MWGLQVRSWLGSLICGIVQVREEQEAGVMSCSLDSQVVALLSYVAAYFPGGTQTLRFGGQMAMRGAGSLLPF
jgi:hypothetical protein